MAATDQARPDGRRALQALSTAALALPAYAGAPPAQTTVDYHFFQYSEDDLAASKSAGSQRARYEVDGHKLQAETPVGSLYGLSADLTVESMSGASPWFITPGANGEPIQVLSGASIEDERQDLLLTATRYDRRRSVSLSGGISDEDDYQAVNVGVQAEFEPEGAQFSYGFGLTYSDDHLEPSDGGSAAYPERIIEADKNQWRINGSFTQILDRRSVLQWGLTAARQTGFLSDPYKLVFIESRSDTEADSRPDERNIGAFFLRWRRHFQALKAALHLDYRGSRDDWEVETHTLEADWVQRFAAGLSLNSGLRYYSQSQAEFYAPFFDEVPADGLMSSDYRLSPFGAISLHAQLNYRYRDLTVGAGMEWYDSDGDWALGNVKVENPGLLSYQMWHLRLAYRFGD